MPSDQPSDVHSVVTTDYNAGRVKSELINTEIWNDRFPDTEFGIVVHQDGPSMALSAGTTADGGDVELYTYHSLDPTEAKELAEALHSAAIDAEAAKQDNESQADSKSLLERIIP